MVVNLQFDQFVDKVIQKNNLIPPDQLEKAKKLLIQHPELQLLDILVRTKLVSEKHAALIQNKFNSQFKQETAHTPAPAATPTPAQPKTTPPSEPPPEISTSSKLSSELMKNAESLEAFLHEARNHDASDLYICVNSPPIIRKHGKLIHFDHPPFTPEETKKILFHGLTEDQQNQLNNNLSIELCLEFPDHGRYRSCFLKQRLGWEGSFRIISKTIPKFENLGLPDHIKKFADYTQGLVLVTGPGGAGKSSTLAAMIDLINQKRPEHIITLEDPIEFKYHPVKSHISQREVGTHTKSFSNALRAALREDPDVILIGELRDYETASLAVTAAETGHLVFSTLHTIDAAQTVMRLLDFFPPNQQNQIRAMVSESLRGIICQRLVPRANEQGRVVALEIMFNVSSISSLIRDNKIFQIKNMIRINQSKGMQIMDNAIKELLQNQLIETNEAHYAMVDNMLFQQQKSSRI